jgi:hypothetical protein
VNFVPFFSRTIGLSEDGAPIPVVGGLRLTGKVGRNTIGVLNMQVDRETRPGGVGLPSANYSVIRYGREFLSNSSVGLFFLDKERGGTSNRLGGADLKFYPMRTMNIDALYMRSEHTASDTGAAWRAGFQYDPGLTVYTINSGCRMSASTSSTIRSATSSSSTTTRAIRTDCSRRADRSPRAH